ncbi:unnamed protein product, partial [Leptidea sinapis]
RSSLIQGSRLLRVECLDKVAVLTCASLCFLWHYDKVRGKPLTKDETKLLLGLIESSPIILSIMTKAASNKIKTSRVDTH